MERLNRTKEKDNILSLVFMVVISCVTQVATVMKSSIVAGTFGASESMDAYNFANSVLSFVFGIIASGVPTVILPAYVNKKDRKGIDTFITVLYGVLLLFIAAIILLRYRIVYLFTNRSEMFANIACNALLIISFFQYLSSFTGITTAYFQNRGKYNAPKIINLFAQLVVLLCLILKKDISIYEYMLVLCLGILINFVIDTAYAVVDGWRFVPRLCLKNEVTVGLLRTFFPIVFSSSVYKLSLFVDSMIASNLDEGKLTVLNYSNMIVGMVNSLIIGNILIYVYPKLIKKLKDGENQGYFWQQTSFFHMIVCLLIVGFFAVGEEGIALLFQRGLFDASSTRLVFCGALIYMLGQQFNIVRDLVYRYFYCMGNTKVPATNSVIVSVTNIAVSLVLVYFMGFYGIIIGTVVASAFSTVMIVIRFNKHIKLDNSFKRFILKYVKNIAAAAITAIAVFATKNAFPVGNAFLSIALFGAETVVLYLAIVFAINRDALRMS